MAITADLGGKNYTLGRGKLFFDRYATGVDIVAATQGEGERYLGNTPGFTMNSSEENLEHFSSEGGVRVKDDSVQLQLDRGGSIVCDNISDENLALVFLGDSATISQAAAVGTVTVHESIKLGRFFQLGVDETNPSGLRNVSNVVVKNGVAFADTVAAAGNYEIDEERGRLYILPDAADVVDGDDIQITFDVAASTRTQVVSGSTAIYGALRYIADNPKGANRDVYMPYVKLAPDGDLALKGDEWMSQNFTLEILKKASNIEAIYVDGIPVTA